MGRLGGIVVLGLTVWACSGKGGAQPLKSQRAAPCPVSQRAESLRTEGFLHQALEAVDTDLAACVSTPSLRLRAEILADLGLDALAAEAYGRVAETGTAADGQAARAAIAALADRPPPTREDIGPEEQRRALALYRDGVNLRRPNLLRDVVAPEGTG